MKTFAKIISILFHPLLFATQASIFVLAVNPHMFGRFGSEKVHGVWLIIVFALTFIFPLVWLAMMKGLQMIDNYQLETTRERIIPFVAIITFYLWTTWMFKPTTTMKIPPNPVLFYMLLGCTISIFGAFFINIFRKVSLHTLAAGNFLGLSLLCVSFSTYNLKYIFLLAIVMAGIIGTARMLSKPHSLSEILMGYLLGFTGQFVAFNVVSKIL